MSNPYMLQTQGPANSKITASAYEMIPNLQKIIEKLTEDNVKNLRNMEELQKNLSIMETRSQIMHERLKIMMTTQETTCRKFSDLEIFKKSEFGDDVCDFLQLWGFKEHEARYVSVHFGIESVADLKYLDEKEWELGDEMDKINLSPIKIEYLKWLCDKERGQESSLNPKIILEIVQSWRDEKLIAYRNVEKLGRDTEVFWSRVHLRARAVVHRELEGDDDIVLHAADLAVEGDALLAEAVDGLLRGGSGETNEGRVSVGA